jgi:hypothetical protein
MLLFVDEEIGRFEHCLSPEQILQFGEVDFFQVNTKRCGILEASDADAVVVHTVKKHLGIKAGDLVKNNINPGFLPDKKKRTLPLDDFNLFLFFQPCKFP